MSYSVDGKTITLTRGDSMNIAVSITKNGADYVPGPGCSVRFAMKKAYSDSAPLAVIDIPINTMILQIRPEHTKQLDFGKYVYDIQLTTAGGDVDTFIDRATLILTEEVD